MTHNHSETHSLGYSMSSNPEISILVCHHYGELLFDFLTSIRKSAGVTYEIILVTSDKSLGGDPRVHECIMIHSTEMPARKRNLGAYVANGKYLAIFDDDTEIESDCLYRFKKLLDQKPKCGMVYGKLYKADEQTRFDEAGGFLTWTGFIWSRAEQNIVDKKQYDYIERIFAGKSASCMVRKDVFDEVGGFDESFGILGEETDLSWRIWLKGHQVFWHPWAVGIHKFNTIYKPVNKYYTSERVQFNGTRNYLTMLIKNLGASHLWIVPLHATIWLGVGLVMLVTGKFRQGVNILRGLGYVVSHLREILIKRHIIQSTRRVSEKELWTTIHRVPSGSYYWTRISRYLRIGLHG